MSKMKHVDRFPSPTKEELELDRLDQLGELVAPSDYMTGPRRGQELAARRQREWELWQSSRINWH